MEISVGKESLHDIQNLTDKLQYEQKTVGELRNFIDVMRIGWSSDKAKLLKTVEELSKLQDKLTNVEKENQAKLNKLAYELAGERKAVGDLRNFIDVMKTGWSSDRAKLLAMTKKLNEHKECPKEEGVMQNSDSEMLTNNDFVKKEIVISENRKFKDGSENSTNESGILAPVLFVKIEESLVSCPLCCNESFHSQEGLKCHLLSVLDNVSCPLCTQKFNITSLINHLATGCDLNSVHEPVVYGAPQMRFSEEQYISGNNDTEDLYCIFDSRSTEQKKLSAEAHKKKEASAENPFACSICPSLFKTIEEARNHIPLHYPGSKAVQCNQCYCLLSNTTVLHAHLKSEHNTDISQIFSEMRQPMLKAKTVCKVTSSAESNSSESDNLLESTRTTQRRITTKENNTDKNVSKVEEKERITQGITPSRSSRKRKPNQIYMNEYIVY